MTSSHPVNTTSAWSTTSARSTAGGSSASSPVAALAAVAGCSADETDSVTTDSGHLLRPRARLPPHGPVATDVDQIPAETGGPYPRRRIQRPERADRIRHRPPRHHQSFGSASGIARRRPADRRTHSPGWPTRTRRWKVRPSICGTATPKAGTPSTPTAHRRELPPRRPGGRRAGKVTFTTIYPAAYQGRWPHIHFEVYASLNEATAAGKITPTSQLALPEDAQRRLRYRWVRRERRQPAPYLAGR